MKRSNHNGGFYKCLLLSFACGGGDGIVNFGIASSAVVAAFQPSLQTSSCLKLAGSCSRQQLTNGEIRAFVGHRQHDLKSSTVSVDGSFLTSEEIGDEDEDCILAIPPTEPGLSEEEFLARTKTLCEERNLQIPCVKNARDLSSVQHSPVKPNRIYRMGKLSDATPECLDFLFNDRNVTTIIDLRSPTELKEDENLHRNEVFGDFHTIQWKEGKRTKYLVSNGHHGAFNSKVTDVGVNGVISTIKKKHSNDEQQHESAASDVQLTAPDHKARKERHFVSLMDEFKYVRGTLRKLRKRDIVRVLIKSPGALLSRRVRKKVKGVFLNEINDGGLPMLNELMLRMGAPGIKYVLEVISDTDRHPVVFHCTAGKDRTGIIAAIVLSMLGVPDEDIVEDYSMSANVYAEINDHTAMVGALSQRNLNPKTFLGAPPQVMRDTLESIRENYGSVDGYLDWIGFGSVEREKLRNALTI